MTSFAADVAGLFSAWDRVDSPGCAVLVAQAGEALYRRGHGMASLEHGVPITPSTVFNVGSVSKQFTAMAILLLEEEGKLSLDDDVRAYVPELPDYRTPITLRHLLHHTSGLREQSHLLVLAGWRDGDVVAERDVLDVLARQRALNFAPGEDFQYSNTGYTLLAVTVRRVAGVSLRRVAAEWIFTPLGMGATVFRDDHTTIVAHRAAAYGPGPDGGLSRWMPASDHVGPTNLYTSVDDLARWSDNFVHPRVGSARTIERLTAPGWLHDGRLHGYAGGLEIGRYRGLRMISHGGMQHAYRSRLAVFPDERLAIAVLANLSAIAPAPLVRRIADLAIDHGVLTHADVASPIERESVASDVLAWCTGFYLDSRTGWVMRVFRDEGRLMLGWPPATEELIPTSTGRFRLVGADVEVVFTSTPGGHPQLAVVGSTRQVVSELVPSVYDWREPVDPATEQLEEYVGRFQSDEIGTLEVRIDRGALVARIGRGDDVRLESTFADTFFDRRLGFYAFTREIGGAVDAVRVTTDRIRALRVPRRTPLVPLGLPRIRP